VSFPNKFSPENNKFLIFTSGNIFPANEKDFCKSYWNLMRKRKKSMMIVFILIYFLPIIVTAAIDQKVANGMLLLTACIAPIINFLADTREGKLGLWTLWTLLYYGIAANMLMTWLGHPLFE
jgi:hypothetical protein